MPVALAIGAGSIISGGLGYLGATSAAKTQADAATQIAQMQQQMGMKAADLFNPYVSTGQNALTSLASLYGVATPGNPGGAQGQSQAWNQMLQTPAYQFAQSQGQLGLDRSSAASGLLLSGAQLKDTMSFNQGLASQQIGNYTNALQGLAGQGLQATQGQASSLTGTSQIVGNTQMSGAQSTAAGIVGGTNALTGGISSGIQNSLLARYMNNGMNNGMQTNWNTSSYGTNGNTPLSYPQAPFSAGGQ